MYYVIYFTTKLKYNRADADHEAYAIICKQK